VATLAELWSALFPAATPVGPADAARLSRDVAWVRVLRSRVPAFDALDPGDVVIVPATALAVVAPGLLESTALVEALAHGGASGLLLLEGEGSGGSIEALGESATQAGIPAFRLDRSDPIPLERAIIGFLVNRRAELEHQAALLEATLEELALQHAELPALVAAIAGFLGRGVALEGADWKVVAAHAPPGAAGALVAVAAYLGGSRVAALRVPLPATDATPAGSSSDPPRPSAPSPVAVALSPPSAAPPGASGLPSATHPRARSTRSAGRLLLLGDRPASDLERLVGARIARLLALELSRQEAVRHATDRARAGEPMPAAGPPWVVLVARQVADGAASTRQEREAFRARLRVLAPSRRLALRGDADSLELRLVAALDADDPGGIAIATRVADLAGRTVAVSRPFDAPGGRPSAEALARSTLEAAEALATPPRVARADRLAAYRLVATLRTLPEGDRHARALLEPLEIGSPAARRERRTTLRAVIERPGLAEAASALGVHRNTLAYRIRRIETLTGWELSDPELRVALIIALELVQSDESNR